MPKSLVNLRILLSLMTTMSLGAQSYAATYVTPLPQNIFFEFSAVDCVKGMATESDFLSELDETKAQFTKLWLQELMEQRDTQAMLSEAECQKMMALAGAINNDEQNHSEQIMPKAIIPFSESESDQPILGYRMLSLVGQEELAEEFNYLQLDEWLLGWSKYFRLGFYVLTDEVLGSDGLIDQEKQDEINQALFDSIYVRPGRCRFIDEETFPVESELAQDLALNLGLATSQLTVETPKSFMSCFDDHGIGVTIERFSAVIIKDHLRGRYYLMVRSSFYSE